MHDVVRYRFEKLAEQENAERRHHERKYQCQVTIENVKLVSQHKQRQRQNLVRDEHPYEDEREDEIASELKIASAFFFERRSPISSSLASGRPIVAALNLAMTAPRGVVGRLAASFATSWPGPV